MVPGQSIGAHFLDTVVVEDGLVARPGDAVVELGLAAVAESSPAAGHEYNWTDTRTEALSSVYHENLYPCLLYLHSALL
ncbi:hypothetical protein CI610_02584 [invertebrate metagenome]|uniref:Uncharacterized protein n=1 Tax=invertebrate metagenome TaxID=1711999 RepID=A0A2H9T5I3_9ZZZZ